MASFEDFKNIYEKNRKINKLLLKNLMLVDESEHCLNDEDDLLNPEETFLAI